MSRKPDNADVIVHPDGGKCNRRDTGTVLHLPEALIQLPEKRLILFNRTSGHGRQVGPYKMKLKEKEAALTAAVRQMTDRSILEAVSCIESGRLYKPRPGLIRAAELARENDGIVVACDYSRLHRPIGYDHDKNPDAWPTSKERWDLRHMTFRVPLATVQEPWLTESERHSLLTKRNRPGRPKHPMWERVSEVFAVLGWMYYDDNGKTKWQTPVREAARILGMKPTTVQAIISAYLHERQPTLGDRTYCAVAVQMAFELGLCNEAGFHNRPLTAKEGRQDRRAEMAYWQRGWYRINKHCDELDYRYKVNRRNRGFNIDGTPDRRYKRPPDDDTDNSLSTPASDDDDDVDGIAWGYVPSEDEN